MTDQVVKPLTDPAFLIALLVGIAVFATIFTVLPAFERQHAEDAHEVGRARARRAARQAARPARRRGRPPPQGPARGAVARHARHRRPARPAPRAGRREHAEQAQGRRLPRPEPADPVPVLPARPAVRRSSRWRVVYLFVLGGLPEQPPFVKLFVCVVVAYAGFYAPVLYVNNRATKRKQSIQMAWPDALDLMLICVESGMSVEAAIAQGGRRDRRASRCRWPRN